MADYRIQLKDKEGNRQFPVTTTQSIVDSEGRSLEEILANLGDGNEDIGGLKYVEERTVYPSKMIVDREEADSYELSETEKAYNIETLDKAINERSVIIVVAGYIFHFVYSESDSTERIGKFSYVGEFDNNLLSISITINQDGDAIWEQKVLELGGGGSIDPEMIEGFIPLSRDFSDDFNNDFAR